MSTMSIPLGFCYTTFEKQWILHIHVNNSNILSTVFIQFQSCYCLLYQCLVPNTREALSLLVQHYSVLKDVERSILSGENPRVCNQGILNYLLIMLRRDKNFVKFWKVLKTMINHPELRVAVERIQKGTYTYIRTIKIIKLSAWLYKNSQCLHIFPESCTEFFNVCSWII